MAVDALTFEGFGESILAPALRRPLRQIALSRDLIVCRRQVQQLAPSSPGVYGWLDRNQRLMYVGKSKSLRSRLLSYFAADPEESKVLRLRRSCTRLVWEPITHDLLALIREQELIYRWQPSFNRQGQPNRRRPGFICLSDGVAPKAFSSDHPVAGTLASFGPILGTGQLRESARCLNYAFGLRDCSEQVRLHLTPQLNLLDDYRHAQCMRHELGSCLGPCAGACTPPVYRTAVERAMAFLDGTDRSILKQLKSDMKVAAQRLAFEKAMVVQSQLKSLKWLSDKLKYWRKSRQQIHGTYPVPTFSGQPLWLAFQEGSWVGYSSRAGNARSIKSNSLRKMERDDCALEMEIFLITTAWFRKYPDEFSRLTPFEVKAKRIARRKSA